MRYTTNTNNIINTKSVKNRINTINTKLLDNRAYFKMFRGANNVIYVDTNIKGFIKSKWCINA